MKTGWERENRHHFDDIVEKYDKIRPGFPAGLYDDIFNYAGAGRGKAALEIGAGTGKATTPVLKAGYAVTAVEPGANMAKFLREKFKDYKDFSVVEADFEDFAPNGDSFDLIYAATAFHWVDAEIGCPKAFDLLRQGGVFALFRYNQIAAEGDALFEEVQESYKKYFLKPYKRPIRKSKADFATPTEIKHGFGFEDMAKYGFKDMAMKFYDVRRTMTADEYIALLDTNSDQRSLPPTDRAALSDGIHRAISRHGGQIEIDYIYQLYMGRKPGKGSRK